VVSFRSGGIPEVVVHGQTGLLAKEGDVEGLAHHLLTLLENPELRDRMGRAGRQWVERHFDLEAQNAKLESVYDQVLARCRQPQD
jgi:glycosyltransferase involved in cell wall biosynthesis